MFRRAPEARFEKSGRKYYLVIGSSPLTAFHSTKGLTAKKLKDVDAAQKTTPLFIRFESQETASLWLYGGRFWWADPALDEGDVKALAEEAFERDQRRLKRARARHEAT